MYTELVENKKTIINLFPTEFEEEYMLSVESFAREFLLDVSECENALYALPQLTRDSFSKKGLFYRTDKVLMQLYTATL